MHGSANDRVDVVSEISNAVSSNTSFIIYSISKECIDYTEAAFLSSIVKQVRILHFQYHDIFRPFDALNRAFPEFELQVGHIAFADSFVPCLTRDNTICLEHFVMLFQFG